MHCLSLSCSQGICAAHCSLKSTLGVHSAGLHLLRLSVVWVTDVSMCNGLLVRITALPVPSPVMGWGDPVSRLREMGGQEEDLNQ